MRTNVRTLTLTSADTEYSLEVSKAVTNISFQCRTNFAVRFATETGKVAGPTDPYGTLKAGSSFSARDPNPSATGQQTWYFASSEAGVVVEFVETFD